MNGLDLNNVWNIPFGFVVVLAAAAAALCVPEGKAMDSGQGKLQTGQVGQADATLIS